MINNKNLRKLIPLHYKFAISNCLPNLFSLTFTSMSIRLVPVYATCNCLDGGRVSTMFFHNCSVNWHLEYMCSIDYWSCLPMWHIFGIIQPFFIKLSVVSNLFCNISHVNTITLGGALMFQMLCMWVAMCGVMVRNWYTNLEEKMSTECLVQRSLSLVFCLGWILCNRVIKVVNSCCACGVKFPLVWIYHCPSQ